MNLREHHLDSHPVVFVSRPLVAIVLAYMVGILLGRYISWPLEWIVLFTVAGLILSILAISYEKIFISAIFCVFLFLGLLSVPSRQLLSDQHITHQLSFFRHKPITLRGIVIRDVIKREVRGFKTSFVMKVSSFQAPWGWQKAEGKVMVNIFADRDISYGDELILEGKLHKPFNFSNDRFSYAGYLENQGIHLMLSVKKDSMIEKVSSKRASMALQNLFDLRKRLGNVLSNYLTKAEAGIMRAILLGDRTMLPNHIRELFVRTGTVHILAISGLNVGIVAAIFYVFLKILPIGRMAQLFLTIVLLIAYAFLTGASPSVVRATIMSVVFLCGFMLEKEGESFNTLCFSALVILLVDPLFLFDIGFQLSFLCVAAILCLDPITQRILFKIFKDPIFAVGWRGAIIKAFSLSLTIFITIGSLIAYYFQIVTPITVIVNLLIIPFNTIIVVLGFGLLVSGLCLPWLALLFSYCLKISLNIMAGIIYLSDKCPLAYFYVREISTGELICCYVALIFIFWGKNVVVAFKECFSVLIKRLIIDKAGRV